MSGLVASVVIGALSFYMIRRPRNARRAPRNWKVLAPGWFAHSTVLGTVAFSGFMAWLHFFARSSRDDAALQELLMLLICAAMLATTLWLLWHYYLVSIRWKGRIIQVRRFGTNREYRSDQIIEKRFVSWRSEYVIGFDDGRSIILSPYIKGGVELASRLKLPLP